MSELPGEGDPILLRQKGFTLAEPALFLRYHPRGSSLTVETAVFVRTGDLCPLNLWASWDSVISYDLKSYRDLCDKWAGKTQSRRMILPALQEAFEDMLHYHKWRTEWIKTGKLYEEYDDETVFDDSPGKEALKLSQVTRLLFDSGSITVGELGPVEASVSSACQLGPSTVIELVTKMRLHENECGSKRVIDRLAADFALAQKREDEGQWLNLCVKRRALRKFGVPQSFLSSSGYSQYPVPSYDQLIFQCDGTDKARTLGMHRDLFPGYSHEFVATLLGCVAGHGKEVLIWKGGDESVPLWWRQEGLPAEPFDYVYSRTGPELVQRVLVKKGHFVFMPKGVWHWVRPLPQAQWTVMVTASFHTLGTRFDPTKIEDHILVEHMKKGKKRKVEEKLVVKQTSFIDPNALILD